jgi:type II secretory pathway component GspD/PulD (secretin)
LTRRNGGGKVRITFHLSTIMKRSPLIFVALLYLLCPAFADDVTHTFNFDQCAVVQALQLYKAKSGLELVVDSRVKLVRATVTLKTSAPLSTAETLKFIEKSLLEQAGVVITPLEDKKASVTYNDALHTTTAKN